MASEISALPYHEPGIVTVLILTCFLLFLNVANYVLDRVVYCGLLGQILTGVWFGLPGANWLSNEVQVAVQQMGYLGLILLVYEGGLSTDIKTIKANLSLSTAVAITGIGAPIALSFVLKSLLEVTSLQAFAAGAALCSTSLGTTFTVLSTSGLVESRLGVVLTSAAMMDDVVGLVMVQVISSLGQASSSFDTVTVIRPVFVSIAFAVVVPAACAWIVAPVTGLFAGNATVAKGSIIHQCLTTEQTRFVLQTLFLAAMVTGASFAGTSNLFAAYLTGVVVTWYDNLVPHTSRLSGSSKNTTGHPNWNTNTISTTYIRHEHASPVKQPPSVQRSLSNGAGNTVPAEQLPEAATEKSHRSTTNQGAKPIPRKVEDSHSTMGSPILTGVTIYESYYLTPVNAILKPFFFASIGFSIPITRMFSGNVVWRGCIYAALMALGKLLCGIWLVRLPGPGLPASPVGQRASPERSPAHWARPCISPAKTRLAAADQPAFRPTQTASTTDQSEASGRPVAHAVAHAVAYADMLGDAHANAHADAHADAHTDAHAHAHADAHAEPFAHADAHADSHTDAAGEVRPTVSATGPDTRKKSPTIHAKPLSLYPAAILGGAMVARGEIGFLISSVAQSSGVYDGESGSDSTDLFLIVTWAIFLCTLCGPLCVGLLVRRVRRLENDERRARSGKQDPLGIWGISSTSTTI